MEHYNPGYVCNHSDDTGRYAFNQQPGIGLFNLSCLAQALLPHDEQPQLAHYAQTPPDWASQIQVSCSS